jgi:hypothetical protein
MIDRRVLYWSGPVAIAWLGTLETLHHWLQESWGHRVLEGRATPLFWVGITGAYFGMLALDAIATHLGFFWTQRRGERPSSTAFRLLPHLVLCGILLGTSVLLAGPEVATTLNEFKLDFLSQFLFYVAGVWSLTAVLGSLSTPSAGQSGGQ